jgi:hypothetical protein
MSSSGPPIVLGSGKRLFGEARRPLLSACRVKNVWQWCCVVVVSIGRQAGVRDNRAEWVMILIR